jgi:hypothetical protein
VTWRRTGDLAPDGFPEPRADRSARPLFTGLVTGAHFGAQHLYRARRSGCQAPPASPLRATTMALAETWRVGTRHNHGPPLRHGHRWGRSGPPGCGEAGCGAPGGPPADLAPQAGPRRGPRRTWHLRRAPGGPGTSCSLMLRASRRTWPPGGPGTLRFEPLAAPWRAPGGPGTSCFEPPDGPGTSRFEAPPRTRAGPSARTGTPVPVRRCPLVVGQHQPSSTVSRKPAGHLRPHTASIG